MEDLSSRVSCGTDEDVPLVASRSYGTPNTSRTSSKEQNHDADCALSRHAHSPWSAGPWRCLIFLSLLCLAVLGRRILDGVFDNHQKNISNTPWGLQQKQFVQGPGGRTSSDRAASTTPSHRNSSVLVVYIPNDAGQFLMAQQVVRGIEETVRVADGAPLPIFASLAPAGDATFSQVLAADAVVLGSSVENGNTHPLLQSWINNEWDLGRSNELSQKVGAAFVTAGGISAGQESTLQSLLRSMMTFQMIMVGGDTWRAAYGAAAITSEAPFRSVGDMNAMLQYFPQECYENTGEKIHPMFLEKAKNLGSRVASLVGRLSHACNC